jgi:class 3 adenylate cyclase/tetratricopeptide (TPR) repeat protein
MYEPPPIETSTIELSDDLLRLVELLARNALDRGAATETVKAIVALGYQIVPPAADPSATDLGEMTAQRRVHDLLARLRGAQKSKRELAVLTSVWQTRGEDHQDPLWSVSPELYRHLGRRLLKLGAAPLALEVTRAGLDFSIPRKDQPQERCYPWAQDVELRQIVGLALARTANPEQAQRVLLALRDEGVQDEETLGVLARTYKDLAQSTSDPAARREYLRQSLELYEQAAAGSRGYWTAINVATVARVSGQVARSREVAHQVREQCRAELARIEAQGDDPYWLLATLGEAALNLEHFAEAEQHYRAAYEHASHRYGDLNSTRRQARWLMEQLGRDPAELDGWIPIPRVVIFAGHMIDQPGRPRPRFPQRLAEAVKARLRSWLQGQHARIGFSSAACGSDILFQEAMHELGGETHVVLPYEADAYMTDSVHIVPEGDWSQRFRKVIAQATQVVTASSQKMKAGGVSYDYANLLLHGLATVLSRQLDTTLWGLAVWDGRPGDGPGGTASVVARWHALGVPVYRIDLATIPADDNLPPVMPNATRPVETHRGPEPDDGVQVMAMLFGDAVNFSSLSEEQVPRFLEHFLAPIADLLRQYETANVVRNTWGDGLYLVFDNVRDAGRCALDIGDFVNRHVQDHLWEKYGLPPTLNMRIALHAGPVFRCKDPVTGQLNYTGTHVSRAARLEPKTPSGQVYASQAFAALAVHVAEFACEYVKQLEWAKHYGTYPTYVVRRRGG